MAKKAEEIAKKTPMGKAASLLLSSAKGIGSSLIHSAQQSQSVQPSQPSQQYQAPQQSQQAQNSANNPYSASNINSQAASIIENPLFQKILTEQEDITIEDFIKLMTYPDPNGKIASVVGNMGLSIKESSNLDRLRNYLKENPIVMQKFKIMMEMLVDVAYLNVNMAHDVLTLLLNSKEGLENLFLGFEIGDLFPLTINTGMNDIVEDNEDDKKKTTDITDTEMSSNQINQSGGDKKLNKNKSNKNKSNNKKSNKSKMKINNKKTNRVTKIQKHNKTLKYYKSLFD